jgi:hypothetical protein
MPGSEKQVDIGRVFCDRDCDLRTQEHDQGHGHPRSFIDTRPVLIPAAP